ncbi:MAG: energy transducer TonB [Prolixibacteraceae bacterium]|jgi:hypothetical protein|nr:energy transducer TonB [Prolixibacteraceae bacterium]MDI9563544.1 energy transducer TonB [Bacteroidota bacterium]NLS99036.1 energy transducer TonB [Bacteroidales bacterium]OQB80881.1 MAG: hypothetical protein BWX87_01108 [Bacteroidetes bacterium ADurb.Bin123]HNZ68186.1 energy transducer TonB [Prolixibacteraceae bacterium]
MVKWVRLYKHNIYGIMGTLLFHIMLVGFFLIADMDLMDEMREREIMVEIPLEMMDAEELDFRQNIQGQEIPEDRFSSVNMLSGVSNRPSNRNAPSRDRFFDDHYNREVEDAKRLAEDVNRQLSREIPDIGSISMPEDVTEGKEKEQISNIVYSGESNVEYHLENRYHLRLPIPVYLARGGGVVTVDITVNRDGRVVSVTPRSNPPVLDEQIYVYARAAAQKSVFNPDPAAPAIQQGTIRYTFMPQ